MRNAAHAREIYRVNIITIARSYAAGQSITKRCFSAIVSCNCYQLFDYCDARQINYALYLTAFGGNGYALVLAAEIDSQLFVAKFYSLFA